MERCVFSFFFVSLLARILRESFFLWGKRTILLSDSVSRVRHKNDSSDSAACLDPPPWDPFSLDCDSRLWRVFGCGGLFFPFFNFPIFRPLLIKDEDRRSPCPVVISFLLPPFLVLTHSRRIVNLR